ncbi:hypothetical protein Psal073_03325 (plasmid) [Piscirickettsia salmonis]|nr:hypothetical protein Psal073_03261 [Piscirickettsia salmonis]QGO68321.1 hypothetical protein Psal073_03325 [Piscirickettsia salmonis]
MNISFKKIFCFFIIVIINASVIFASPGPLPPRYFYRADTRTPMQIFGSAHIVGAGFLSWGIARGVTPDYDVVSYAAGITVAPNDNPEDLTAGWVSASGDLYGVEHFLDNEFLGRGRGHPDVWVYQIAPTERAYSVNWMLEELLITQNLDPEGRESLVELLDDFEGEDEWVTRDRIRVNEIAQAYLYRYDAGTGEYHHATADVIQNPHFVPQQTPPQQTVNPAIRIQETPIPTTFTTYNPNNDTTDTDGYGMNYGASCAGVAASFSSHREKRSLDNPHGEKIDIPKAPGCNYSKEAAHKIRFKDLPTIPSQLITTQGGYCLAPTQSRDSSMKTSRSYLYAQTCSNVESQKAIYDTLGRVAFSKSQFGIPLCMTAPENVIKGDDKWDYVEFWPCDIYNPYQKWDVRDGKLKPRLNKDLSIQWYGNYGIISKSSGTNIVLDANKMSKYFFKTPSKVNTFWYEIGMRFYDKSDNNYYPMYSGSYNSNYLNRTYYDMKNSRILILSLYGRAFSSDGWFLSCLTSNIAGKTTDWDWVYFKQCDPFMDNVPNNLKWFLESRVNDPVSAIYIKNSDKSNLYVTTYNHFGSLFDAKSSQSPSSTTMYFDLSKRYGVCTNSSSSGWYVCNDPKHTRYEDDEL